MKEHQQIMGEPVELRRFSAISMTLYSSATEDYFHPMAQEEEGTYFKYNVYSQVSVSVVF